jgi:hypothetical protein
VKVYEQRVWKRRKSHLEGQLPHSVFELPAVGDTVIDERLADDVANSEARVERGVGVLEHHLELASVRPHLAERQGLTRPRTESSGSAVVAPWPLDCSGGGVVISRLCAPPLLLSISTVEQHIPELRGQSPCAARTFSFSGGGRFGDRFNPSKRVQQTGRCADGNTRSAHRLVVIAVISSTHWLQVGKLRHRCEVLMEAYYYRI